MRLSRHLELMSGTSKSKSWLPDAAGLPGAEDSADPPDGPGQEFRLANWWFRCCTRFEGCLISSGCCLPLPENQPPWNSRERRVHMTLSSRCCQLHELYRGPDRDAELVTTQRATACFSRRPGAQNREPIGKSVGPVDSCATAVTRPSSRYTDV